MKDCDISTSLSKITPTNDRNKDNNWDFLGAFLEMIDANNTANSGDKYCNVMAKAKGRFCRVIKYKTSAIVPAVPLTRSNFLLLPNNGMLSFLRYITQIKVTMMDL